MYTIYQHINKINGKSYVGYTKHHVLKRFQNHLTYSKRNSQFMFHKAIRKYGRDCWDNLVLAVCETVTEARQLEKKFIFELKTNKRGYGYNMTEGGEGNVNKGKPLSFEHKMKVIIGLRKHVWTKEEYKIRGLKLRGKKRSIKARKAISDGIKLARLKGSTIAQKLQLEKLHAQTKGTKRSIETCQKISLALKGKPKTKQHRLAMMVPKSRKFQSVKETQQ